MYDPNDTQRPDPFANDYYRQTGPGTYRPAPAYGGPGPRARRSPVRTGAIILLALVALLIFGTGLFAGWQFGRNGQPTTLSGATNPNTTAPVPPLTSNNVESVREAVVAKVRPSVVQINVQTQQGTALGSGVIIDNKGYIITNNHVVAGANTVEVVLYDGKTLQGRVMGTAPGDDLAVVQVDPAKAKLTVANIGDSSKLRVGQEVLAIGNPLGITQTVTNGIVSALERTVSTGQNGATLPNTIQTDAPINPGNSGGALVDLQGNLVGIPTLTAIDPEFKTPANGVGFAIPSNRVKFIAPQLIDNGRVMKSGRAALGIQGANVDPNLAAQNGLPVQAGVLITSFANNSAAAKAGMRVNDIIVQIEDTQVGAIPDLSQILLTKMPGDTVKVTFYRGNEQRTANVQLGELQE